LSTIVSFGFFVSSINGEFPRNKLQSSFRRLPQNKAQKGPQEVKTRMSRMQTTQDQSTFLCQPNSSLIDSRQCQEKHPRCDNCARLSLRCRYLPEAAAIATRLPVQRVSSLHIGNIFSLTDMRLFHHFLVAAFPHFPVRSDNIWLSYITPLGHQASFPFIIRSAFLISNTV
jgi:hypothetical protein